MPIEVTPARLEHVTPIALNMRAADRAEIWLSSHAFPIDALEVGYQDSQPCWTALVDGEPALMFGATPVPNTTDGFVWLLGTPLMEQIGVPFIRQSRAYVAEMLGVYSRLYNFVHAENVVSIRWLQWLGFTVTPAQPFGPENAPFRPFMMERTHV